MKKNILLAACISAVLLLTACSSPEDSTKEDPILDFPATEVYYRKTLNYFLNEKPKSNVTFLLEGYSYKLGIEDGGYFIGIDDLEVSSTDRSAVEIYKNGYISAKSIGKSKVTVKSKSKNFSLDINMYVMKYKISSRGECIQFDFEVPENMSSISIYRVENNKDILVGQINSKTNNRYDFDKGEYVFKDYFVKPNTEYTYKIGFYDTSDYGTAFIEEKITSGANTYGELEFNPGAAEFDPTTGKLTVSYVPTLNIPSTLKTRYKVGFYTNKEYTDSKSVLLDSLTTDNDLSQNKLYTDYKGTGISIYGIHISSWLYDESSYSSAGVYWASNHYWNNPKIVSTTKFEL